MSEHLSLDELVKFIGAKKVDSEFFSLAARVNSQILTLCLQSTIPFQDSPYRRIPMLRETIKLQVCLRRPRDICKRPASLSQA